MVPLLEVILRGCEALAAGGCPRGAEAGEGPGLWQEGTGPSRIHFLRRETEDSSVGRDLPDTAKVLARGPWQTHQAMPPQAKGRHT